MVVVLEVGERNLELTSRDFSFFEEAAAAAPPWLCIGNRRTEKQSGKGFCSLEEIDLLLVVAVVGF